MTFIKYNKLFCTTGQLYRNKFKNCVYFVVVYCCCKLYGTLSLSSVINVFCLKCKDFSLHTH